MTGASEGIGEAIVRRLAIDGGASVVLAARQQDKLASLCEQLETISGVVAGRLLPIGCDVTSESDVKRVVRETIERYGRVDVLINCAGCMYYCLVKNGYTQVSLFSLVDNPHKNIRFICVKNWIFLFLFKKIGTPKQQI